MKRVLSFLLVLILALSLFAFGETASRIEDVNDTEITDAEDVRLTDEKDQEYDQPVAAATSSNEIADANNELADASDDIGTEVISNEGVSFYGKVQDDAFVEEAIVNKVVVPSWFKYLIRVTGVTEGQTLSFKSSSTKYAAVDAAGLVTFKKAGTVKITATITENKKTVLKKVIQLTAVSAPTKVSIMLPEEMPDTAAMYGTTLMMEKGSELQLGDVLTPYFTTSDVTWKTSGKKYVTVSETGLITAVAKETAKITVTTKNKKTATLSVKVVGETDAVGVSLTGETALDISELGQLICTLTPADTTSTVKWSTSSKTVCAVSADGVLMPKKCGAATITATVSSGIRASVKVTVTDRTIPVSVTLDKTGTVTLYKDQTLRLNATMLPETATGKLTWSTSGKSIATVTAEGLVTPRKKGMATITVKTRNGKMAKVKIKVIMTAAPTPEPTDDNEFTYNDIDDTTCAITGYTGSRTELILPLKSPDGKIVTAVADEAFAGNTDLTKVTIYSGITSIGSGAFSSCTNLNSVSLPSTLTILGASAFSDCTSLESVKIPGGVARIEDNTFSGCSNLESVTVADYMIEIGYRAFYNCSKLHKMRIEN